MIVSGEVCSHICFQLNQRITLMKYDGEREMEIRSGKCAGAVPARSGYKSSMPSFFARC